MTNSKQSSAADSPAVKCFSSQSSEGECEKPVPAFDRIRMRDYEGKLLTAQRDDDGFLPSQVSGGFGV